jgi:Domain of unknown function (DUF4956)
MAPAWRIDKGADVPLGVNLFFWESIFSPRVAPVMHALAMDLGAIAIVAYGIFYRRYRRADLVVAYVAVNLGLFVTGVLIVQQMHVGVAFGFGLFAILSIIRLRSDPIAPEESAYYFLALVLGLVNGMQFRDRWLIYVLDAAIVAVMLLLDNKWVLPRSKRQMVTLDRVHPDEQSLRADLQERLNGKVLHLIVRQTDYVRETTVVDVRLKPHKRARPQPEPQRPQVGSRDAHPTLDLS